MENPSLSLETSPGFTWRRTSGTVPHGSGGPTNQDSEGIAMRYVILGKRLGGRKTA